MTLIDTVEELEKVKSDISRVVARQYRAEKQLEKLTNKYLKIVIRYLHETDELPAKYRGRYRRG